MRLRANCFLLSSSLVSVTEVALPANLHILPVQTFCRLFLYFVFFVFLETATVDPAPGLPHRLKVLSTPALQLERRWLLSLNVASVRVGLNFVAFEAGNTAIGYRCRLPPTSVQHVIHPPGPRQVPVVLSG